MGITFPNESRVYREARNALLQQEIELRRQMEAVAVARRSLPLGGEIPEDYVFDGLGKDGKPAKINMSELFREGTDTVLIYNFMFPRYKTDTREPAKSGETARLPKAERLAPHARH